MSSGAARLILAERCAQAGITKRTTRHYFRRAFIGNLIPQDIGIAQRTARHANVTMTVKHDRSPDKQAKEALRKELNREMLAPGLPHRLDNDLSQTSYFRMTAKNTFQGNTMVFETGGDSLPATSRNRA